MFTVILVCYLLLPTSQAEQSLKQLHILFRHGDRSPSESYPTDPYLNYSWQGGWGALTNLGRLQLYKLGQILRKQYSDFIPVQYSPKNVAVNSSHADRCIMSAQVLCAGMFPPTGEQIWTEEILWQPIPVHYLPRDRDTTLVMKKPCPKYEAMFKDVENSPALKALEIKYKNLLEHLTKHTGMSVKTVGQVESLYITLDIERYHNLTLPNWVNDSMMADMKMLAARTLAYYSETEYMKRIRGGSFLKHVLRSMGMILNGKEETVLNLYAAHDITLVHVLRSLHLVDDTVKPDYGAYLIFELYSDGEVKFKYSGSWDSEPDPSMVLCRTPCKLKELQEMLKPMIPVDYDQECQLDVTSSVNGSVSYSLLTSYVIVVLSTVIFFYFPQNFY